ncbi:MAG: methyltransferase domain-containing protein [Phycisphaerae bacterium]|nr:methyltransferase domain-containing protein [Phycisphaerae bacterium]
MPEDATRILPASRPTEPELMDADDIALDELERSFRFIYRVNRWFGGAAALRRVLADDAPRWPRDRPIRWLDLGTGAADIPLAIDAWAARAGHDVRCVALDRHPGCLALARKAVRGHPRIEVVSGDALDLSGFGDRSFDYVHAGMFLHHLHEPSIISVLQAMGRIASRAVVWNDLSRSAWAAFAVWLVTVPEPAGVKFDARLSVRKGFTAAEALALAERARLRATLRPHAFVGRFAVVGAA